MKHLLSLLLLTLSLPLFSQHLNNYGHIIEENSQSVYNFEAQNDGHISIQYKNKSYQANALIELSTGFVTIQNTCGNTPPLVTFYDNNAFKRKSLQFNQTINPQTDLSGRYLYFLDNAKTTIIDTETLSKEIIATSDDIAISKNGAPIYFNSKNQLLITPNQSFELLFTPNSIEIDDQENIYAFGRNQFIHIQSGQALTQTYQNATFFESKCINGKIFWVEKQKEGQILSFNMNKIMEDKIIKIDKQSVDMSHLSKDISYSRNDGVQIVCPMFPDMPDYPFRIGNSYGEHQKYGPTPYLHPGVDLLGEPNQEIYSPVAGFVKAIITTSGDIHWRLALGLEDTVAEQEGYLFAHLNPQTIPFVVGDKVEAGDYLGSIVEWPVADFHHLHFARILHNGKIWDGNWLTKDNVLSDITNFKDESAPVFEPLWNEQTIAFRSKETGAVLEPNNLKASFDIVCHAHDKSNDDWRLDIDSLWFEVVDLSTNDVVHEQESFSYDFTIDTYFSNVLTLTVLNTIYATDELWQSVGNYDDREFYQQVSRSNADGVIDYQDALVFFDSRIIPNGSYLIRVHAYDAAKNHNSTEIEVIINNELQGTTELENNTFSIYPNPNSGQFNIKIIDDSIVRMDVVNNLGQLVVRSEQSFSEDIEFHIPTTGIFFVRAYNKEDELLGIEKLIVRQ